MTQEEKKAFFAHNKTNFVMCMLKIFISFNPAMPLCVIQENDFLKCLKTLRTKDSFKRKGFKKTLLHEELFTFEHTESQINKVGYPTFSWDENGNLIEAYSDITKQNVRAFYIKIQLYYDKLNRFYQYRDFYRSFLKMFNDYFSFCMKDWDSLNKAVELWTYTPDNNENDVFPKSFVYYTQQGHRKEVEQPINFYLHESNSKHACVDRFVSSHSDECASKVASYESWIHYNFSTGAFEKMRNYFKVICNEHLAEVLFEENGKNGNGDNLGSLGGYYSFPVDCTKNYWYNEN